MAGVLAAEWWKLRTARSTYWVLLVPVLFAGLMTLLALQAAHFWDGLPPDRRAGFRVSSLAELTAWVSCLCLAVLGVVSIMSEYRTGMIRVTFIAVPRRSAVLMAKAGVVGSTALGTGLAVTFASYFATQAVVGDRPIPGLRQPLSDAAPGLAMAGVTVAVHALLALGLAVQLRSTAGAIVSVAFVWHVLPVLIANLPAPWDERIGSLMLAGLAAQVVGDTAKDSIYGVLLPPGVALGVLVAYAALPLGAAAYALARRDA